MFSFELSPNWDILLRSELKRLQHRCACMKKVALRQKHRSPKDTQVWHIPHTELNVQLTMNYSQISKSLDPKTQ